MPVKAKVVEKHMTPPKGVALMNLIRAEASETYKERVPVATQENIKDVGNPILNFQATFNEFVSSLVNRIAFTVISSRMYRNKLAIFNRGYISTGETIEEIFIDLIKAEPFYLVDPEGKTAAQDEFEQRLANVHAVFHRMNRRDKYPLTVSYDSLRTAFISWDSLDEFVRRMIETLYSSDNFDQYLLTKNIFNEAGNRGALHEIDIPEMEDKATLEQITKDIIESVMLVGFMSDKYNFMGVKTFSNPEDLVLFVLPKFVASLNVDVLATAFHDDRISFEARQIVVDDFGGLEKAGVKAILVDKDWLMIYDDLYRLDEANVSSRLYKNFFLHHWQTFSYSPFKTAIAFTTIPSEVISITITPAALTLVRNATANPTSTLIKAEVSGKGMYDPTVVWSTTIGKISQDGLLEIPNTEPNSTGIVTAISKQDPSIQATMQVTLISPTTAQETLEIKDATGNAPKTDLERMV